MTDRQISVPVRRLAPDAFVGLAVFVLLMVMMGREAPVAASQASQSLLAGAMLGLPGQGWPASMVLLFAVLSALVTFNLAFLRHLVRAYAAPGTAGIGHECAGPARLATRTHH